MSAAAPIEFIPTDYALAYSALARRVAAARAYIENDHYDEAEKQLASAMGVISQVENARAVLTVN